MNFLFNLLKKSYFCIDTQIEFFAKFFNNFFWLLSFIKIDILNVCSVIQFYSQNKDRISLDIFSIILRLKLRFVKFFPKIFVGSCKNSWLVLLWSLNFLMMGRKVALRISIIWGNRLMNLVLSLLRFWRKKFLTIMFKISLSTWSLRSLSILWSLYRMMFFPISL